MIEMRVGKKHDVDLWQLANGQGGRGQAFGAKRKTGQPYADPRKKNRISKNCYPEKIDKCGCVPEPSRSQPVIAPRRRIWPGKSGRNWTPTFAYPFIPEINVPTASARTSGIVASNCHLRKKMP